MQQATTCVPMFTPLPMPLAKAAFAQLMCPSRYVWAKRDPQPHVVMAVPHGPGATGQTQQAGHGAQMYGWWDSIREYAKNSNSFIV